MMRPDVIRTAVWAALGTVLDPEIDEPITELDFVESCTVDEEGVAAVRLRLPTFFCAPNFSFLMVANAYDAVSAVPGVTRAEIALLDHHASTEINGGVAAHAGFVGTFSGEAVEELDDLRAIFLRKAALAGQDRVARPLVDAGASYRWKGWDFSVQVNNLFDEFYEYVFDFSPDGTDTIPGSHFSATPMPAAGWTTTTRCSAAPVGGTSCGWPTTTTSRPGTSPA